MMPSKPKLSQRDGAGRDPSSAHSFIGGNANNRHCGNRDNIAAMTICQMYDGVVEDLHRRGLSCASQVLSSLAAKVKQANPRGKRDPVGILSDELCCEVLSYLCAKPETHNVMEKVMTTKTWFLAEPGQLYFQLSSVSQQWKAVCDQVIPWNQWVGLLDLDVKNSIHSDSGHALIRWLIRNKIRLGSLTFSEDICLKQIKGVELVTSMFSNCPMDDLVRLTMFTAHYNKPVQLSPTEGPAQRLKSLHDLIARSCQNLKEVRISLMLPKTTPIYSDYVSQAFFSNPSIENLHLWVGFYPEKQAEVDRVLRWGTKTPIDGRLFSDLIQNLPKLVFLRIETNGHSRKIRFHVASATLKELHFWDNGAPVASLDCPALERLWCNGARSTHNNCLLSHLSRHMFNIFRTDPRAAVLVRSLPPSPHLQVHNDCKLALNDMDEWGGNDYEEFLKVTASNASNSVYQVFEKNRSKEHWESQKAVAIGRLRRSKRTREGH